MGFRAPVRCKERVSHLRQRQTQGAARNTAYGAVVRDRLEIRWIHGIGPSRRILGRSRSRWHACQSCRDENQKEGVSHTHTDLPRLFGKAILLREPARRQPVQLGWVAQNPKSSIANVCSWPTVPRTDDRCEAARSRWLLLAAENREASGTDRPGADVHPLELAERKQPLTSNASDGPVQPLRPTISCRSAAHHSELRADLGRAGRKSLDCC